jgi:hypothetical protein
VKILHHFFNRAIYKGKRDVGQHKENGRSSVLALPPGLTAEVSREILMKFKKMLLLSALLICATANATEPSAQSELLQPTLQPTSEQCGAWLGSQDHANDGIPSESVEAIGRKIASYLVTMQLSDALTRVDVECKKKLTMTNNQNAA